MSQTEKIIYYFLSNKQDILKYNMKPVVFQNKCKQCKQSNLISLHISER